MMTRRTLLKSTAATAVVAAAWPAFSSQLPEPITRPIPSSGQRIPVIGMGTWQTFNVTDKASRDARTEVLRTFFDSGGTVIDTSPMYGSSQETLGYAIEKIKPTGVFSAEKIWTRNGKQTIENLETSRKKWGIQKFELMQIHNLLAWEDHLPVLQRLKAEGKIRYIGITTSHRRRHTEIADIMKKHKIDFLQATYNIEDRYVESRLLPLAADRGIAVMVNRPFQGGDLLERLKGKKPLPGFAAEIGCTNWPQFLLKFAVSHPAVTVAIPATSKVAHMRENMGAGLGVLPDAAMRAQMIKAFEAV